MPTDAASNNYKSPKQRRCSRSGLGEKKKRAGNERNLLNGGESGNEANLMEGE